MTSSTRPRRCRRALTAAAVCVAVLLPAALSAAVVILRRPGANAYVKATGSSRGAVDVSGELLGYRNVLFDGDPLATTELPRLGHCSDVLEWLIGRGGGVGEVGRMRLLVSARRPVQMTVANVTVRVLRREPAPQKSMASCSTSDGSHRIQPVPGWELYDDSFSLKDSGYDTPVILLNEGDRVAAEFQAPTSFLAESAVSLRRSEVVRLPFYVARAEPDTRVSFVVDIDLTVNGVRSVLTVGSADRPFFIHGEATAIDRFYDWQEDTLAWTPYQAPMRSRSPLPRTRECLALPLEQVRAAIGPVDAIEVNGFSKCYWSGAGGFIRVEREVFPTSEMAHQTLVDAGGRMYRSTPLSDLGEEAMTSELGGVIARRGATVLRFGINSQEFNGGTARDQVERLARRSFATLW